MDGHSSQALHAYSRIISFNMARRSIMEFKGRKMIWAMYDEHAN